MRPLRCLAAAPFHLRTRRVSRALKGLRPALQFSDAPGYELRTVPLAQFLACSPAARPLCSLRSPCCVHAWAFASMQVSRQQHGPVFSERILAHFPLSGCACTIPCNIGRVTTRLPSPT